jgi:hypothetical protein
LPERQVTLVVQLEHLLNVSIHAAVGIVDLDVTSQLSVKLLCPTLARSGPT